MSYKLDDIRSYTPALRHRSVVCSTPSGTDLVVSCGSKPVCGKLGACNGVLQVLALVYEGVLVSLVYRFLHVGYVMVGILVVRGVLEDGV